MLLLVKTPLTCIIFMIYTIGFYYRKPHIPTRSTKIFQRLTVVALLNSVFDLITICTVNNRDVIPDFEFDSAHHLFTVYFGLYLSVVSIYEKLSGSKSEFSPEGENTS